MDDATKITVTIISAFGATVLGLLFKLISKLFENISYSQSKFQSDYKEGNEHLNEGIKFTINSHVVELKTGNQFRIIKIDNTNNRYICSLNNGITSVSFAENEIELFSIWVKNYKRHD